jgi:hypothetical protein
MPTSNLPARVLPDEECETEYVYKLLYRATDLLITTLDSRRPVASRQDGST